MNERRRILAGRGLLLAGALLALGWVGATLDAGLHQAGLAARWSALTRAEGAPRLAPARATRREAETSGLIGRIEIPRLGISAFVIEGIGSPALRRGVGHVPGSAYPGEAGNVALAGHRDGWFSKLGDIERGDLIHISTPDGRFAFAVESLWVVKPSRGDLIASSPHDTRLTLVTCYPFHWIGPAPERFVVLARPVVRPESIAARRPETEEGAAPRSVSLR